MCILFFVFFKQKTAYEMRISDWSSDVCSSDLSLAICPSYLIRRRGSSRRPGSSPWLSPCQVSRSGFLHLPGERADHTEKRWQEQTPRQTALSRAKSPENCGSCRARHLMLRLQVDREALFDPPFELIAHITVCLQSGRAVALDKDRSDEHTSE